MSDDLIRRSDVIKAVNKAKAEGMTECPTYYLGIVPTIEPRRGGWKLFYESKDGDNVYKCSCCRFITVIPEGIKLFSFCPNCGARMKGADDE